MRIIIGWSPRRGVSEPAIGRSLQSDGKWLEIVRLEAGWTATQWKNFLATEPSDRLRLWGQYFQDHGDPRVGSTHPPDSP